MSFFKASTKEEYSLRLVVRLASTYQSKQPLSIADIAEQENISRKYLEELIIPLKQIKLIKAIPGRRGGYLFLKNPKNVSVKDIIWLVDDNPKLAKCAKHGSACAMAKNCQVKKVWQKIQLQVEKSLAEIKLIDLLD